MTASTDNFDALATDFSTLTAPRVTVAAATKDDTRDAAAIAAMYEAALGKGGVKAEGHDAYPDGDLFTAEGVAGTLAAGERLIGLARKDEGGVSTIVGAMVCDRMSPYHVEFNSMAVPVERRGQGIGSILVSGLADIVEEAPFTVNCTELVTHSLASQSAHIHNGFKAICGFGYCHYPHVFFKDHPESVLWAIRLQGALVPVMKKFRSALGRNLGKHAIDVKHKLVSGQASGQVNQSAMRLDDAALDIVGEVLKARSTYVPQRYSPLVQAILFQFENILDRDVHSYVRSEPATVNDESNHGSNDDAHSKDDSKASTPSLTVDFIEGMAHSYVKFAPAFKFDQGEIDQALAAIKKLDKRFIKVMIPANNPEAIKAANYLNSRGFVFHSYLPLYGFDSANNFSTGEEKPAPPEFYDVLSLQWIKPSVVENNPMPGETDSVIKLYGYPENLSGQIVKTIARELHEKTGEF